MRKREPSVVPYLLFVASFVVKSVASTLAVVGVVPRQNAFEVSVPVNVVATLVSLIPGVAALIVLAWGKPVRQVVSIVLAVVAQAVSLLVPFVLTDDSLDTNSTLLMMLLPVAGVMSLVLPFFLMMSAWVVAASYAPWMFAVALVASIAKPVLSGLAGLAGALEALVTRSPAGMIVSPVLALVLTVVVFTGVVLVGRHMTVGMPTTDSDRGFSISDRIGW